LYETFAALTDFVAQQSSQVTTVIFFLAPNPPEGLTVDTITSTSVTISWSAVDYTDNIYSIQQYQVHV